MFHGRLEEPFLDEESLIRRLALAVTTSKHMHLRT